jgi:hypothetical protein
VSDRENLDIPSASPIRDDIIPDNKPTRAGQWAGRAGIGKLGKLLLGAFEGPRKTICCRLTVLGERGRNFLNFNSRASRIDDAYAHFRRARSFPSRTRSFRVGDYLLELPPQIFSRNDLAAVKLRETLYVLGNLGTPSSRYWRSARTITQERGRSSITASLSNA